MKYKVGDKVRIKNLDWYNQNKDVSLIESTNSYYNFIEVMRDFCGKVMTISSVNSDYYDMVEDAGEYYWTDEMIEGLVEEEIGLVDILSSRWVNEFNLPEGYIFKDENGNIINATKIVLEKKKKEYPKTYEECAKIMGVELWNTLWGEDATEYEEQMEGLMYAFIKLKVCRDAYWKIAGEEMGLGKPWKPDWTDQESPKYCITSIKDQVEASKRYYIMNTILAFQSEEIRNAFYENFKELIESCKELL